MYARTANEARRLLSAFLLGRHLTFTKLSAKRVGFSDLARTDKVIVTVYGWQPNTAAVDVRRFGTEHGFVVHFDGF